MSSVLGACGRNNSPSQSDRRPEVLNLYEWADYIDPTVITEFEHTTGIKVTYSTFDSQEAMETKMLTASTGYDVVDVASYSIDRLVKAGVFRKLDRSQLPHWGNLDAELMHALEQFDPQNQYAVGYLWGTTGIGYNAQALKAAIPDAPLDSWALLFDPKYVSKAGKCGVSVNNYRMEIIGNALIAGGGDPNRPTLQQMRLADAALQRIRPYVRRIDGGSQMGDLVSGSMCLMVTSSSNVAMARNRNKEVGVQMDLRYVIPKEGAVSWFDLFAIPVDAPHSAAAYTFLDFLLRPEIAARNANFTGSATVNRAAVPFVDSDQRSDPMLYPDAAIRARLTPLHSRDAEQARAETQLWTRFEFQTER
jgi:putrescine transport system substrate-binding protein